MTATELIQIIAALGTLVTIILSGVAAIYAARAKASSEENRRQIGEVKDNVLIIEKATNSMKDALVAATRSEALQEGHARGVEDQKIKQDAIEVIVTNEPNQPVPTKSAK